MTSKHPNQSLEEQIRILNKFPDQNPNFVMKVSYDGRLIYANPASSLMIQAWKIDVRSLLPEEMLVHIKRALESPNQNSIEIKAGYKTFSFNLIPVHEFEFINIYGIDITASKVIKKFPAQNPNPVMKVSYDGRLIYANSAGSLIIQAWKIDVGSLLPKEMQVHIKQSLETPNQNSVEIEVEHKTFSFSLVPVHEFEFINIYGTDITASKVINKFPDQNPNPVMKVSTDYRLIYANNASSWMLETWEIGSGDRFPSRIENHIKQAVTSASVAPIEVQVGRRFYSLSVVSIPEFDFINIYGTNITAIKELEKAHKENENLLLNILPSSIADRLKQGETTIADKFENLTILFADVVGFTQLSATLSPTKVVQLLNSIFTVFDQLTDQFELEKIKTIGDAYMVVGGFEKDIQNSAEPVADMALAMKTKLDQLNIEYEQAIKVRCGIHTGPGVAGVIGKKKFIYDVWGDTVNTASRMESHSIPEQIQVSEVTYQILKNDYDFIDRGIVDIKGKGPMRTYFLQGKKV